MIHQCTVKQSPVTAANDDDSPSLRQQTMLLSNQDRPHNALTDANVLVSAFTLPDCQSYNNLLADLDLGHVFVECRCVH